MILRFINLMVKVIDILHYLHFRPLKFHVLCQLDSGRRVHILREKKISVKRYIFLKMDKTLKYM